MINAFHHRLAQNMGKKFATKRDKSGKKPTINKWVFVLQCWGGWGGGRSLNRCRIRNDSQTGRCQKKGVNRRVEF